jgi:hypothetical protein
MESRLVTVLCLIVVLWASAEAERAVCSKRDSLFRLERSKNKNIVQYNACLSQNNDISD